MSLVYQGKVDVVNGTKITCTVDKLVITCIVINNLTSNYTFTLNRFETGPGIHSVPMYKFELDLGDSIRDTTVYELNKGDYLEMISDTSETTYYIIATEQ